MKKYLITGVIFLLPIIFTLIIVKYLLNLFTKPFLQLILPPLSQFAEKHGIDIKTWCTLVHFTAQVIVLILIFLFTLLLGYLARRIVFKSIINTTNRLFAKIPVIKGIYNLVNDMTKIIFSDEKRTFERTVLAPFPYEKSKAIGFVTKEASEYFKQYVPDLDETVFVPTSPHPISGFLLLTPNSELINIDMKVDEAFKFLISCGIVEPEERTKKPSEDSEG